MTDKQLNIDIYPYKGTSRCLIFPEVVDTICKDVAPLVSVYGDPACDLFDVQENGWDDSGSLVVGASNGTVNGYSVDEVLELRESLDRRNRPSF